MKSTLVKMTLFISFISFQALAAGGSSGGPSEGGGTATIKCSKPKHVIENTPLEAFSSSFTDIPGSEKFVALLNWYENKLLVDTGKPGIVSFLSKITDDAVFHWSLIPRNCEIDIDNTKPDVPFIASFGVYYDGAEGMVIQKNYPTDPKLQLIAITHEAVRLVFCGLNEKCTRIVTETLLEKYNKNPDISSNDLRDFLDLNIYNDIVSSAPKYMPNGPFFAMANAGWPYNIAYQLMDLLSSRDHSVRTFPRQ